VPKDRSVPILQQVAEAVFRSVERPEILVARQPVANTVVIFEIDGIFAWLTAYAAQLPAVSEFAPVEHQESGVHTAGRESEPAIALGLEPLPVEPGGFAYALLDSNQVP